MNETDFILNGSTVTKIQTPALSLDSLSSGNQSYALEFNLSLGLFAPSSCLVDSQSGNSSLDLNSSHCEGSFSIAQASENYIHALAENSLILINSSRLRGIEVLGDDVPRYADPDIPSNLEDQYFLEQFNITNHIGSNFSEIEFSPSSANPAKNINLSVGTNIRNGSYKTDILEEEEFIIAGTTFSLSDSYNIVKYFWQNNTLAHDLPSFELAINIEHENGSYLAESQDGILWPDSSSWFNGTHIWFNITNISSGLSKYHRFSYDAFLATYSGEESSDYRLSGDYKEWTLDRVYYPYFNLSGKTLQDTILQSRLGEWLGKTASWTAKLYQPNGSLKTSTTTDEIDYVDLSFSDVPLGNYTYQIKYYTTYSPSSGGGGGGGGSTTTVIESSDGLTTEEVEDIIENISKNTGYVQFLPFSFLTTQIYYLPEETFVKEVIFEVIDGPVSAEAVFSDELNPYFEAYICDLITDTCRRTEDLKEGDQRYLYIKGRTNSTEFHEKILEENHIEGFVQVASNRKFGTNTYNITIEVDPRFEKNMLIADKLNISSKTAHYLLSGLFVILIASVVIAVLKYNPWVKIF